MFMILLGKGGFVFDIISLAFGSPIGRIILAVLAAIFVGAWVFGKVSEARKAQNPQTETANSGSGSLSLDK